MAYGGAVIHQKGRWIVKVFRGGLTVALLFGASLIGASASAQTIVGSPHDFSTQGWSGGQICVPCHTPHNANVSVTDAPLWNHALTTKVFQLYTSPTLNAIPTQPTGASKLCLSCHDGTVAIDSFGGATGTIFMNGDEAVGRAPNDLKDDHPLSFQFDTALATADGGLNDPATKVVTIGSGSHTRTGTIAQVMLYAGQLQCASCHDVHNNFVAGGSQGQPLLKITKTGSAICLACHNK
jgi:hypothetical protein